MGENSLKSQSSSSPSEAEHRRRFEGQLNKFTNVVKGWQYRWFVLDPESGRLEYYLLDEKNGKCRGSQHLAGGVVLPSEEDSQTFTVNFASGEVYKVRASHAKERQMWVDRLRACAYMHNEALAHNHPSISIREQRPPTPPGSRSHISNGEPSEQLQTLSLSVLDAFGSVHDILNKVDQKHQGIAETIESYPASKSSHQEPSISDDKTKAIKPECHNEQLLLLKATSQATLKCMEGALSILQELRGNQLAPPVVIHQTIPVPTAFSQSSANLIPASPHRNVNSLSTPNTPARHSRPKSADSAKTMH